MRDTGIVVQENGQLGIRATFKKRYITLAPIAGVVGLAFNVKDPNKVTSANLLRPFYIYLSIFVFASVARWRWVRGHYHRLTREGPPWSPHRRQTRPPHGRLHERHRRGKQIVRVYYPIPDIFITPPCSVQGEDVFIPMSCLLGGQARAGFGWNMLMDCLAEGRGISLPVKRAYL